jgi:hypothetical protein
MKKNTVVKVVTLSRLAYANFHLFLHLKKHLAHQIFHEKEKVKKDVSTWLRALAAEF